MAIKVDYGDEDDAEHDDDDHDIQVNDEDDDKHLFVLLGVIIVLLNQLSRQTSKSFAFLTSCVRPEN